MKEFTDKIVHWIKHSVATIYVEDIILQISSF